jgi:hypothetical protein
MIVLSRLRNVIFKPRRRSPDARFADIMRRVNRMARLLSTAKTKPSK